MISPCRRFWDRCALAALVAAFAAAPASADLTLRIEDYVKAPKTGNTGSASDPLAFTNAGYLARLNFLAEEPSLPEQPPVDRNRLFVNDLNGPLYILDKTTKQFTTYLDFNGKNGRPGMFQRYVFETNFANGLITFQFDPEYANNGKFYTVHMEDPDDDLIAPEAPVNTVSYTTTSTIDQPGNRTRVVALVEWTDTNINNSTFEGSARELMRIDMPSNIHPMGDIIFNPNAKPGDADWRMMYVSVGDGGAGEQNGNTRRTPQRLDSLAGKVLRIRPDNVGATTPLTRSGPTQTGPYYIPNNNPFTGMSESAVRDEIFSLGHRNIHRITWDGPTDTLIVNEIGLHTWEEVNIIKAGQNYGYSEIEGNQYLGTDNDPPGDPLPSTIPRRTGATSVNGTMVPVYPVIQYGHGLSGQPQPEGDSITSGYVYRGNNIPSLQGKFIYGDITTGQLFWSDFAEMKAVDDGNPNTMAAIHQIDLLWDNPDSPGGETLYQTRQVSGATLGPMFDIVERSYEARGGTDPNLPGGATVTGNFGRADIRIQVDEAGELYMLSKSDGVIRYIVEAVGDADFNNDQLVDGSDFIIWQQNLGLTGQTTNVNGDADGDGIVGASDLHFVRQQFMPPTPPNAAVPEPAAGVLALMGLVALGRRRR